MNITIYTDPYCPFAYSAEPIRWRLLWLYGDQLTWHNKMIVLSGYQDEVMGITPEQSAEYQGGIREKWGMPINNVLLPRKQTSILANKTYLAALHAKSDKADLLLRNLRFEVMNGVLLDEQNNIDVVVTKSDIDLLDMRTWIENPEVETQLNANAEDARNPLSKALAFKHKLSTTTTGRQRYSAPSYQFSRNDEVVFELPGMWPLEAYEAAIGNLEPSFIRRENPTSVKEILEWAGMPLATAEIKMIYSKEDVQSELEEVAIMTPLGQDGLWELKKS